MFPLIFGFYRTQSTFRKAFHLEATDVTTTFLMVPHHPRYFYVLCPDKYINCWGEVYHAGSNPAHRLLVDTLVGHDEKDILVPVCVSGGGFHAPENCSGDDGNLLVRSW